MAHTDRDSQSNMECTGANNSVCFGVSIYNLNTSPAIMKVDFSSLGSVSCKYYSNTSIALTSVNVIDEHEIIVSGFNQAVIQHAHLFFRLNYSDSSYAWSISSPPFGK